MQPHAIVHVCKRMVMPIMAIEVWRARVRVVAVCCCDCLCACVRSAIALVSAIQDAIANPIGIQIVQVIMGCAF